MFRRILMIIAIVISGVIGYSQGFDIGISGGASLYSGDLDPRSLGSQLSLLKPSFGAFYRYHYSSKISFRANLLVGKLAGDDAKSTLLLQRQRNLSFSTSFTELSVLGEYDLFGFNGNVDKKFSIYATAGLAYFNFNPTTLYNGQKIALQPLGTEGQGLSGYPDKYSLHILTIPLGGGLKYRLTDNISLQAEMLGRVTFTDYLDDVSGNYVNYFELLPNGTLAAALGNRQGEFLGQTEPVLVPTGTNRGQSKVKDYYLGGTISVFITLDSFGNRRNGKNIGCPSF